MASAKRVLALSLRMGRNGVWRRSSGVMRISYRQAPLATRKDMTACFPLTHLFPSQRMKALELGRCILPTHRTRFYE